MLRWFTLFLCCTALHLYAVTTPEADDNASTQKEEKSGTEKKEPPDDPAKKENREKKKDEPPKVGNFSLPSSQQPSALFGLGNNIIDEGEIQAFFFADGFFGKKKTITDILPYFLFGVSDDFSIIFGFPYAPTMQDGRFHSNGLRDFYIQTQYAFYNNSTKTYVDQASLVLGLTVPTGSVKRNPITGFGSPSILVAANYYRTMINWFFFACPGAILTMTDQRTKIGNQFIYQCGLGRNFPSPEGWIFAWMLEIDGQYSNKDRIKGSINEDSGGNVIFFTPSLWFSNKQIALQFGASVLLNQNLFGKQGKFNYALNLSFAWSFY